MITDLAGDNIGWDWGDGINSRPTSPKPRRKKRAVKAKKRTKRKAGGKSGYRITTPSGPVRMHDVAADLKPSGSRRSGGRTQGSHHSE